jgi:hypothetical protein
VADHLLQHAGIEDERCGQRDQDEQREIENRDAEHDGDEGGGVVENRLLARGSVGVALP